MINKVKLIIEDPRLMNWYARDDATIQAEVTDLLQNWLLENNYLQHVSIEVDKYYISIMMSFDDKEIAKAFIEKWY